MHPDLISALARQRQAEILRHQKFREQGPDGVVPGVRAGPGPLHQVRRSVGSVLVAVGTRLMAPGRPDGEFAVHASRDGALR